MALELDDTQAAVLLTLLGLPEDTTDIQLVIDTVQDATRDPMLPPADDAKPSDVAAAAAKHGMEVIDTATADALRRDAQAGRQAVAAAARAKVEAAVDDAIDKGKITAPGDSTGSPSSRPIPPWPTSPTSSPRCPTRPRSHSPRSDSAATSAATSPNPPRGSTDPPNPLGHARTVCGPRARGSPDQDHLTGCHPSPVRHAVRPAGSSFAHAGRAHRTDPPHPGEEDNVPWCHSAAAVAANPPSTPKPSPVSDAPPPHDRSSRAI